MRGMKIYFIRHGETTGDVEERFGGAYDDHLSEKGREQSEILGAELKDAGIQIVYSSSLMRAMETAAILARHVSGNVRPVVEIVDGLVERNQYGPLSGMKKHEAKERHPEHVEAFKDRHKTIEGAESYEASSARVEDAFRKIVAEAEEKHRDTIAIVSHGGPLRILFRDILKWGEIENIGDCAYALLEKAEGPQGTYTLLKIERFSHIKAT